MLQSENDRLTWASLRCSARVGVLVVLAIVSDHEVAAQAPVKVSRQTLKVPDTLRGPGLIVPALERTDLGEPVPTVQSPLAINASDAVRAAQPLQLQPLESRTPSAQSAAISEPLESVTASNGSQRQNSTLELPIATPLPKSSAPRMLLRSVSERASETPVGTLAQPFELAPEQPALTAVQAPPATRLSVDPESDNNGLLESPTNVVPQPPIESPLDSLSDFELLESSSLPGSEGTSLPPQLPPSLPSVSDPLAIASPVLNPSLHPSSELPVEQPSWYLFADPVLQEMIERIIAQNPTLRDSQARITQARAIQQQARADLFPQLTANTQYGYRRFSQNGNAFVQDSATTQGFDWYSGGFDTRWEVDLFGRLKSLRNAAGFESDAAVQDCKDVMLTLVGDLMLSYIEFSLANERIRIAEQNLAVQQRILEIAKERRRIGEEGDLVVMQAQNQVDLTRTMLPPLHEQRSLALHRLMVLQGLGLETPSAPAHWDRSQWGQNLPELPAYLPRNIEGELLARRPDIRSNRLAVMAQAERVGASRAEYLPKLLINGSVSLETRDLSKWWDEGSLAHSVGPTMSLNLLDFGRIRAGVTAERAKYVQAVAKYEQSVLEAIEEVRNAMASCDAQRYRTATLDTAAKSASAVVDMAMVEYREGMTNFQNVLDAERQLLSVQDQRAVAQGMALVAYAKLFKSLGGTWAEGTAMEPGQTVGDAAIPAYWNEIRREP